MNVIYDELYKKIEAYDANQATEKANTQITEMAFRQLFQDIVTTIINNYPLTDAQRNLLQQTHAYYAYWDADQIPGFTIGAIWGAMAVLDANENRKQDELHEKALKELIENVKDFRTVLMHLEPNTMKTIQDLVTETHINEETILRILVVFQQYRTVLQSIYGMTRCYSLTSRGAKLKNELTT